MTTTLYVGYYINVDEPLNSEIIAVSIDFYKLVEIMIKAAHYTERNGQLLQYLSPTEDYNSINEIREKFYQDMHITDFDVYGIEKCAVEDFILNKRTD